MQRDFNDTLLFVKVVEKGSFTHAAKELGMPKATLSRKVAELENRLGTRLLKRTTRSLGLTEAGTVYYEHGARIARELTDAESAVGQLSSSPRGWLRITAPPALGADSIAPLLPEFMAKYPDVRIDMHLSNERMDLVASEMDLALRVGPLADSTLTARKLATLQGAVFASPDYLARHGEPLQPEDLRHHRALCMEKQRAGAHFLWPLVADGNKVDAEVSPVLVANDVSTLLVSVLAGVGVALLPESFGGPAVTVGRLRRILARWSGVTYELNAVFPPGRMHAPKVRVFVDFLAERLNVNAIACRVLCGGDAAMRHPGEAGRAEEVEAVAVPSPKAA